MRTAQFIFSFLFHLFVAAQAIVAFQQTTTIADQYDSIIAYDAPDGQILYYYETRQDKSCSPIPDWGSGGMGYGVGYHYYYDAPVKWLIQVAGSYECADECYRSDCKEFKIIQPFYNGRGQRPPMTCMMLWKGCFPQPPDAPVVRGRQGFDSSGGETMSFHEQRIYKPNALYTYFTSNTNSYCAGPGSGDLFQGGISARSAEQCASLCLFYAQKICAAFGFDSTRSRCYLKTINCSVHMSNSPRTSVGERKMEFFVKRPWMNEKCKPFVNESVMNLIVFIHLLLFLC